MNVLEKTFDLKTVAMPLSSWRVRFSASILMTSSEWSSLHPVKIIMSRKKVTKRLSTQNMHRQCPHVGYSATTKRTKMVVSAAAASPYIAPQIVRALLIEMCDRVSVAKIDNVLLTNIMTNIILIYDYLKKK